MSESLFSEARIQPSGMSQWRKDCERSVSAPNQTVSAGDVPSSEMDIIAGSRVMVMRRSESRYSKRPARAYMLRVVSISSTLPNISTSRVSRL